MSKKHAIHRDGGREFMLSAERGPAPPFPLDLISGSGADSLRAPNVLVWLAEPWRLSAKAGGARRDRTDDLLLAKQALSQLSYGPALRHQRSGNGGPGKI